jgi:predicted phosphodiesterase
MFRTIFNNQQLVVISDTHGRHRNLDVPAADILIHCGDACNGGNKEELADFFIWYAALPARHRLFISGNHDLPFELEPELSHTLIPSGVTWLRNRIFTAHGIRIGALEPHFFLENTFADTGKRVDILLSHQPPHGILDRNIGCKELRRLVMSMRPNFHFFGHVHQEAGKTYHFNNTTFVNACTPKIKH